MNPSIAHSNEEGNKQSKTITIDHLDYLKGEGAQGYSEELKENLFKSYAHDGDLDQ